jgi:anion transporter
MSEAKGYLTGGYLLKLLSGPAVAMAVYFTLEQLHVADLEENAKICAALYLGMIFWWSLQPIPWAATALVPLVVLPILGLMPLPAVATMYGQPIMFFMIGMFLIGIAVDKHKLGLRFTVSLLAASWVKGSFYRLAFAFMLVTFILGGIVNQSVMVFMIPIGVSTVIRIKQECENQGIPVDEYKVGTFFALAALYSSEAGYLTTPLGAPQNAVALALLEQTTGYTISFVQWLVPGLVLGIVLLFIGLGVLKVMFDPGIKKLPSGDYLKKRRDELGPMTTAEKNVIAVLVGMILLLVIPSNIGVKGIDIFWVLIFVGLLLNVVPSGHGESLVTVKDLAKINWNIIFLVTSGVAMAGIMKNFHLIQWGSSQFAQVSGLALLSASAMMTVLLANFVHGPSAAVAMLTLMLPAALKSGINPAIVARIIPGVSLGMLFPWSGLGAALTFSSGYLNIKDMFKGGIVVTVIYMVLCITGFATLIPLFGAYTQP